MTRDITICPVQPLLYTNHAMNQPPLKIISLNTQRGIFLEKIISFFQSESPDILCLQEIYQHDFEHIQQTLGLQGVFTPGVIFESQKYAGPVVEGVGILTHHPIIEQHIHTYTNNKGELSVISDNHAPEKHLKSSENIEYTKQRNIVCITIQIEEVTHTCATTHFTWGYYGYIDTENKQFIWQPNTESVQRQ
jgi:exonuclease III